MSCGQVSHKHILKRHDCRGLPGGKSLSFACTNESNQRKVHPLCRPFGVPSFYPASRAAHKLARSAARPRAQTYSPSLPPAGWIKRSGAEGIAKQQPIPTNLPLKGRFIALTGWLASQQARALREGFDFEFLSLLRRFVLSRQPGAVKANMFEHVAA